jgi:copper chaperone CopZ
MNKSNQISVALRTAALLLSAATFIPLAACSGTANKTATMTGPNGEVYEEKPINHSVTPEDIAKAQSKAPVAADTAVLYVNGMGCPLCATNINMQLERVPGVRSVAVDLGVGKVTLGLLPGAKHPSPHTLGEAVEDAGFTLVKVEER